MSEFTVEISMLERLAFSMMNEMNGGLSKHKSSLLMIPTYITKLPNGNENGNFLALDFGGSTFRVILAELKPNEKPLIKSTTISMENTMKSVSGEELFNHLAKCVAEFVTKEGLGESKMPLGFTFSFPMNQTSLYCGTLIRWTKGFENSGVVNRDVAQMLNAALANNKATENIEVVALTNDTAGTLVAGASCYPNCMAGLIIGTGSNAAYMEKVAVVAALKNCSEENVVINMEWGNFGEHGHLDDLQTKYDKILDESSNNSGKQLFEKMIGGMYLGELVRFALLERVTSATLFAGVAPDILTKENSLDGAVVSNCIRDAAYASELFTGSTEADVGVIQEVCNAASNRAARLAAAGVHAIWLKRDKEEFTVAVDGSVFLKHATFANVMRATLLELGCTATLAVANDGSGMGSALIAAIA